MIEISNYYKATTIIINFDFRELIGIKIFEFKKGEVIINVIAKTYFVLVQPTKQCNMLK